LAYQLSNDGCSLNSLYDSVRQAEPIVIVILTGEGEKLGAYLSAGLRSSQHHYGTGETFVFRLTPTFEAFTWNQAGNNFFTASSPKNLSVGGGDACAIYLGEDLLEGWSGACPTFASPPLASGSPFRIVNVEAWQIGERVRRR
jgi:hypothetical protein